MPAIVTPDGRYHGHTDSEETARKLETVKKGPSLGYRLLTDEEWERIVTNPTERKSLCETLGIKL